MLGTSSKLATRRSSGAVQRGRRIAIWLIVTSGVWLGWQYLNRPQNVANPVKPACNEVQFEGDGFTICRFDPELHSLELAFEGKNGEPLRGFSALAKNRGKAAAKIVFAMNAGMYNLSGMPVGLYIAGSKQLQSLSLKHGRGNFHMKPNGVMWQDPTGWHVAASETYAALKPSAIFATQSGPMLVVDGKLHPRFSLDGESRYVRNGVGQTNDGKLIFVISKSQVSFGKFARLFRDRLACPNALYFDGLVSSLWDAGTGRIDQRFPLGPMLLVSEK